MDMDGPKTCEELRAEIARLQARVREVAAERDAAIDSALDAKHECSRMATTLEVVEADLEALRNPPLWPVSR